MGDPEYHPLSTTCAICAFLTICIYPNQCNTLHIIYNLCFSLPFVSTLINAIHFRGIIMRRFTLQWTSITMTITFIHMSGKYTYNIHPMQTNMYNSQIRLCVYLSWSLNICQDQMKYEIALIYLSEMYVHNIGKDIHCGNLELIQKS